MSLDVQVMHRMGTFTLDVAFHGAIGLTALFGASGSGKTTVVNIVAGLVRPDRGRVVINGQVLVDTDAGTFVPPHRRRVGYVFQEPRLFPHMNVRQNLFYGRWFTPHGAREAQPDAVIDLLGLAPLLDRRPIRLSGGEKQRVAIGRAWLTSPRLLLMDEPLSSLDAPRKEEILPYIERLRDESHIPIVYVSHSLPEVVRLATQVVMLSEGRVTAVGHPEAVLTGVDSSVILEARVAGHDATVGITTLDSRAGSLRLPRLTLPIGTAVRLRIRSQDVLLAVRPPDGLSARNVLPAVVAEVSLKYDPVAEVRLDAGGATLISQITRETVDALGIEPGRRVYAIVKAVAFDRSTLGSGLGQAAGRSSEIVDV
jgi:molybdate transport system ATP-binding protein